MALEELGYSSFISTLKLVLTCHSLPYKVEKIDMSKNTQKEEYVVVSRKYQRAPNNRAAGSSRSTPTAAFQP
jgi:hypothetical protein